MRKLSLVLMVSLLTTFSLLAETTAKGVVRAAGSGSPLSGVTITFLQQNISTQTNTKGEFTLSYLKVGADEVSFSKQGYFTIIKLVDLKGNGVNDLGVVELKVDAQDEIKQEVILQLSETELSNDESRSTQNVSGALASKGDVYTSQTSFSFTPMRFRTRGYDQDFESTYINGVHFNGLERESFNYSSLGGLNDAFRNQEEINGIAANSFSYGNLGSTTNINAKASSYAAGSKASFGYTNRAYKLRGQYTYATGLMANGWAFAGSAVVRWADKGIVDGTFYNSAGYFFSAEKVINKQHSISFVTFGAPTQRAQQGAVTQEVYDLAGSIYYNPYWGYQDGKVRSSRVVKSFDPTAILSHDFKIDENQRLRTGIAYHYSLYSNSALTFYGSPDSRSEYYRYLPSFPTDDGSIDDLTSYWANDDSSVKQINWNELYKENYMNNQKTGSTNRYAVERRHNDLRELSLNSTYTNQISPLLKLTAGIEGKTSKGMHYKTMDDLLGGNKWVDIDQFAERDYPTDPNIIQNDLNHPNQNVQVGDIFGYHYDLNIKHASAFIQNEWNLPQLDLYYAAKITATEFYRYGYMLNGRAEAVGAISYGKGKEWYTTNPSIKAGATYKIDGRNRLYFNVTAETRAPQVDNSYVSVRIKDTAVPMENEQILSTDLNYAFTYKTVRGRLSAFRTTINNSSDLYGYYDDENQTFVNFMLSGLNKLYQGLEAGLSVKLNSSFTISMAGTYANYKYTSNSVGIKNYENGKYSDSQDTVLTNGLKIAAGPQLAGNFTLSYFHPKMWFADVTLNYFDNNYLDFAPSRFSKSSYALYTTDEMKQALGTQEKLKGGFLLDASLGKMIYLKNRRSLNINFSVSNILNNTSMITGGYQQARLPLNDKAIDATNLNRFPNKYYYAWGFNMFLNVGYKF